uniref:Uncharacterized protein n=1 Tax=Thermodesulfobacterium geofontis TaxID=1295609 RepID=A0A7V4JRE0_9BACT
MDIKQQRFKIAPTGRGAIFRLKRWFYLAFYGKNVAEDIKEKNKNTWLELSRRLIEEINNRGASEKPTRITLEYEDTSNNEFRPISVIIEVMEMKPLESFKIYFMERETKIEEAELEEKEKLKTQLIEILKKVKELGIKLEDIIK